MSLRFTGYTIGTVESGIEPLGRVWCGQLAYNGINQFVIKNIGIFLRCKITISLTPCFPAVSHTVCHLLDAFFRAGTSVGLRYARFAEIFLCKDVSRYLAP